MKNIYLFSFIIFSCVFQACSQENSDAVRPNILFIAVDDLKPTIGSFGDSYAITPNIDKLSEKATIFLNNHTQQAICGPSRASLMTGKRPDYTKVRDLKTRMRDVNPDILTIPQYFKESGYTTAITGKIFDFRCIDKFGDKVSWTIPYIREYDIDYPEKYGKPEINYYQNKEIKAKYTQLKEEARSKGIKDVIQYAKDRFKPPFESSNAPDEAYTDGAIAVHALKLLDTVTKDRSKPFFLAVGFKRPHLPFVAPKKYWDLYNREDVVLSAYQKKAKKSTDLAYHNSFELLKYKTPEIDYIVKDGLLELSSDAQKKLIHGYYASVSFVDVQIGKIVKKLKQLGLDKNTIIVLWGDHGWHLGDHSMWNKHSNFEQATRSPLIISAPYLNNATLKVSSPTEFLDIFPTLCELSGVDIPEELDGKSLFPIMNGAKKEVKKYAVSQYPRGDNTGYSFRTGSYRYTVWIGNNKKSTDVITLDDIVAQELYDYSVDPLETSNFFGEKEYKSIEQELLAMAEAFFTREVKQK
ncbi:sulfatase [Flavivirga spongiicola]|uniref:Sulfatase n=1 Tax=Flavivirga spongiicola TaxID=421621 RepID=A0ABU7XWR9_9FLAO|nr:sulfatase [Flavivirga sp. MEBiC05379]MDO5980027.1 sulfatase [Flavivirga sp. MEBiC05379]